jgi:hypothetical protein
LTPPLGPAARVEFKSAPLGLTFDEVMTGYYQPTRQPPPPPSADQDHRYRELEAQGRPDFPIRVSLALTVANLTTFFADVQHRIAVGGEVRLRLPDVAVDTYPLNVAESSLELLVERDRAYSMTAAEQLRIRAQEVASGQLYRISSVAPNAAEIGRDERLMRYCLSFDDRAGRRWMLVGYKRIRDDPGPDLWRAASSLHVCLLGPHPEGAPGPLVERGAGVVRIALSDFTTIQLPSFRVTGAENASDEEDSARVVWALLSFTSFFFGALQRIYLPQVRNAFDALMRSPHRRT